MKAEDVVVLDVGSVSPIAEYFVFATGTNSRHVSALANEVHVVLKKGGMTSSRDGVDQGYWAVLDYGPMMVHIFQPGARDFYDLEMLWGDGRKVRWKAPRPKVKAAEVE